MRLARLNTEMEIGASQKRAVHALQACLAILAGDIPSGQDNGCSYLQPGNRHVDTNETARQSQELAASEMSAAIPEPSATVLAKLIFVRRGRSHWVLGVCWSFCCFRWGRGCMGFQNVL